MDRESNTENRLNALMSTYPYPDSNGQALYPEFPFCFADDDSIPPVAAAAIFVCIPSRAKDPVVRDTAFAGTKKP